MKKESLSFGEKRRKADDSKGNRQDDDDPEKRIVKTETHNI